MWGFGSRGRVCELSHTHTHTHTHMVQQGGKRWRTVYMVIGESPVYGQVKYLYYRCIYMYIYIYYKLSILIYISYKLFILIYII